MNVLNATQLHHFFKNRKHLKMAKLVNFISCIFSHRNKKSWGVVIKEKKKSTKSPFNSNNEKEVQKCCFS